MIHYCICDAFATIYSPKKIIKYKYVKVYYNMYRNIIYDADRDYPVDYRGQPAHYVNYRVSVTAIKS